MLDAGTGKNLAVFELDEVPVFDGISIAGDEIYMVSSEGRIICLGSNAGS
jgi:hypothetical protein